MGMGVGVGVGVGLGVGVGASVSSIVRVSASITAASAHLVATRTRACTFRRGVSVSRQRVMAATASFREVSTNTNTPPGLSNWLAART